MKITVKVIETGVHVKELDVSQEELDAILDNESELLDEIYEYVYSKSPHEYDYEVYDESGKRLDEEAVQGQDTHAKVPGKIEVQTTLGKILVTECGDARNYPGVSLEFVPASSDCPVGIALAEVTEATEETGRKEAAFHLRPYVNANSHMCDEDGQRVNGKISPDAPFEDIQLTCEDFDGYLMLGENRKGEGNMNI